MDNKHYRPEARCTQCNLWYPEDPNHPGYPDVHICPANIREAHIAFPARETPKIPAEISPDTKQTPGPLDAFETLKPGERHWTLQEFDPFAPPTMLFWAEQARRKGIELQDSDDPEADELLMRATQTEQMAWSFQATQKGWKQQHEHDQEQHKGESKEDMEWRLAHFDLRKHIIERLNNALAEANDQLEHINKLELDAAETDHIRAGIAEGVQWLKIVAKRLEPKRKPHA